MTRPEPVAPADLVRKWEADRWDALGAARTTGDALAKALDALKDTAAERDRAHATLREIVAMGRRGAGFECARLASERLENP